MHASLRFIACALAAVSLSTPAPEVHAHPGGGWSAGYGAGGWHQGGRVWAGSPYGWWRGGRGWNGSALVIGSGIGVGLGLGFGPYYAPGYWVPGTVVAVPAAPVQPMAPALAERPQPAPPEPVIYPNRQQSAAQTEADRQDCNRWAMTQPGAVAEASVFHRAALACMEGRGYTVR